MQLMKPKPLNRESIYEWRDYADQFSWDHVGIVSLETKEPWLDTGGSGREAKNAAFDELEKWTKSLSRQQSRTVHWLAFPRVSVSRTTLLVFLQGTSGMEWRLIESNWQFDGPEFRGAELYPYYPTLGFMTAWAKYHYVSFAHGRTSQDISEAERVQT